MKFLLLLLSLSIISISCSESKEKAEKPKETKEEVVETDTVHTNPNEIKTDFILAYTAYSVVIPKGAYIEEDSTEVRIFLEPGGRDNLLIRPSKAQVNSDLKTIMHQDGSLSFTQNGVGFLSVYISRSLEADSTAEAIAKQFEQISQSIEPKVAI